MDHLPGLCHTRGADRHWPGGHKFAFLQVTGQKPKKAPTGGLCTRHCDEKTRPGIKDTVSMRVLKVSPLITKER